VSGWSVVAGVALGAATWCARPSVTADPSLLVVVTAGPSPQPSKGLRAEDAGRPAVPGVSRRVRRLAAGAAALAVLVSLGGLSGLALSALLALALDRWLARLPGRATVAASLAARRQLPLALDLMAAALSGGATTSAAVVLAAEGSGSPLRRVLLDVAASLRLGAGPDEAWRPVLGDAALQPLGRLAVRSSASGAAMAKACRELAGHERQARVVDAEVAIKRAGVLAVLPLGLCFLPAFVLVGIVPIVVGLLRSLAL
jgi:pilus assembly protein TadC